MPYYGRFGYVEMIVFLMAKSLLLCRLFTVVRTGFVCGLLCTERSTNRCSRRCVCGWSGWPGRFLPNMGGNIISELIHLLRRHRHSFGPIWLYCCHFVVFIFFLSDCLFDGCVHLSYAEAECRSLCFVSSRCYILS